MEVVGTKPGAQTDAVKRVGNLAVGERLSPCGKFAINTAGEWRELAGQDQVAKTPEMVAVDADGKHIIPEPILK